MIWWLLFAGPAKAKGTQFLGVAIVDAESSEDAIREAWRLKINPGGECMGFGMPEDARAEHAPYMNRLLDENELKDIGVRLSDAAKSYDEIAVTVVKAIAQVVCAGCNPKKE
jgi:hypothetical protein